MAADTIARSTDAAGARSATRATFCVMGCSASVVVVAPSGIRAELAGLAASRLHELEQRWSRFVTTSEISGLNRAAGAPRIVSADTMGLVEALVRAWHATDGSFDPTLLVPLVELGYAASRDDETLRTSLAPDVLARGNPAGIRIDPSSGWVQLPPGTVLDPGGLGKGLAADVVVAELLATGAEGVLVEIGGDIRVGGEAPDGSSWAIAVDDTPHHNPTGTPVDEFTDRRLVALTDGAVATSSSRIRTWRRAGRRHHHLLDPNTRRSTDSEVVGCTVIAGTAAWAEAFTKVAFVDGVEDALARFDERGLAASITTAEGTRRTTTTWEDFAR